MLLLILFPFTIYCLHLCLSLVPITCAYHFQFNIQMLITRDAPTGVKGQGGRAPLAPPSPWRCRQNMWQCLCTVSEWAGQRDYTTPPHYATPPLQHPPTMPHPTMPHPHYATPPLCHTPTMPHPHYATPPLQHTPTMPHPTMPHPHYATPPLHHTPLHCM